MGRQAAVSADKPCSRPKARRIGRSGPKVRRMRKLLIVVGPSEKSHRPMMPPSPGGAGEDQDGRPSLISARGEACADRRRAASGRPFRWVAGLGRSMSAALAGLKDKIAGLATHAKPPIVEGPGVKFLSTCSRAAPWHRLASNGRRYPPVTRMSQPDGDLSIRDGATLRDRARSLRTGRAARRRLRRR